MLKMKKYLVILFCLPALLLHAQEEPNPSFWDQTEFKVGYVGNLLWNNGLNVGAEKIWKEKIKTKVRKTKEKRISNQLLFTGNLGFTNNFASKTDFGAYTNYGLTWRRTNTKGKQLSIAFNPFGYYRSFLPETYRVRGDEVKKVFLPGRSYYAPSFSIEFGKNREGKKLTGRYIGMNVMFRTPYNAGTLPTFLLQYGYRFTYNRKK